MANTAFRRVFLAIMPIGFGLGAGAFTAHAIFAQLFLRLHPSPEIAVTVSPLAFSAWLYFTMGLSAFAAGLAAAWLECWENPGLKLGGLYGFGMSLAWLAAFSGAYWWTVGFQGFSLLVWPLFLLQLIFIPLAGIVGRHLSRRA